MSPLSSGMTYPAMWSSSPRANMISVMPVSFVTTRCGALSYVFLSPQFSTVTG